jgi:hypothetical protein
MPHRHPLQGKVRWLDYPVAAGRRTLPDQKSLPGPAYPLADLQQALHWRDSTSGNPNRRRTR